VLMATRGRSGITHGTVGLSVWKSWLSIETKSNVGILKDNPEKVPW